MTVPVWFITGSSNGFGLLLSLKALEAGHRVIATVRDPKRSAEAVQSIEAAGGKIVEVDMTESKASITKKIQDAEKIYGRIDYLVNNAGYSVLGVIELFTEAEAEHQIQTNFFGPLYATQAVLPGMRTRGSGTIINVSSVAGQDGNPSCGLYAASKFGLEGFTEALAKETKEFGIDVLLVEPGAFRTNFLGASVKSDSSTEQAYKGSAVDEALKKFNAATGKQAGDPKKAVNIIFEVATGEGTAGHLKGNILRLPLGQDAFTRIQNKINLVQQDLDASREVGVATDLDSK
ncbi:oxidoreductase yusz [Fusarium albosuccineum]|uniref:Oxidoreductase yusz n=1 Tax=Fusarium albosuccineum TaxID=1237068 RepID=A0A8H4LJS2_9HYPO|nr:oxidoreductase yusz [Fusarium albosuccineum]